MAKYNISGKHATRICATALVLLASVCSLWGLFAAMMHGVHTAWHVVLLAAVAGIPGALVVATIYVLLTKRNGMRRQAQGQARSADQESFSELQDR